MGFSTDQIYDWLMETPPTSAVMEQKLIDEESEAKSSDKGELAQLLEMSPEVNNEEAQDRIRKRQELLRKLDLQRK
jgi:hypothetical protein